MARSEFPGNDSEEEGGGCLEGGEADFGGSPGGEEPGEKAGEEGDGEGDD